MTQNDFLRAIARKLDALWPDRKVYANQIPANADGNHYVRIIETTYEKLLDRRRKTSIQFEVLFFAREDDNMSFHDWSEMMHYNFELLKVADGSAEGRLVHLTGRRSMRNDNLMAYQFMFDANFYLLYAPLVGPIMEMLDQEEAVKGG